MTITGIPNISRKVERIEESVRPKQDDEAQEYTIRCILSRLSDDELDIISLAARYREAGHSEDEIEQYLDGKRKLDEYWRALKKFEQIHAELVAWAARGDLPGIMIAGREVYRIGH